MDKQGMERRDFLKGLGSLFLGLVCLPALRLFKSRKEPSGPVSPMREAMYYKSGDHLAG